MKQVVLNLPDFIDLSEREISMTLAAKLYEERKLSIGQAAELVGISKRSFIELLGTYNVSLFNYPPSELSTDVRNA